MVVQKRAFHWSAHQPLQPAATVRSARHLPRFSTATASCPSSGLLICTAGCAPASVERLVIGMFEKEQRLSVLIEHAAMGDASSYLNGRARCR